VWNCTKMVSGAPSVVIIGGIMNTGRRTFANSSATPEVKSIQHRVGRDLYKRVTGSVPEEKLRSGIVDYTDLNFMTAVMLLIRGLIVVQFV